MKSFDIRDPKDITIAEIYLTAVEGVAFEYNSIGMIVAWEGEAKELSKSFDIDKSIAEAEEYRKQFEESNVEMTVRRRDDFWEVSDNLEKSLHTAETAGKRLNVPYTDKVIEFFKKTLKYLETKL